MKEELKVSAAANDRQAASAESEKHRRLRARVLTAGLLFSLGFTVVFILLGAAAGLMGRWLDSHHALLGRVAGGVIILLGLFVTGALRLRPLYREFHFHPRRLGVFTAPLAGMAFAIGWCPCTGPFLWSILGLAGATGLAGIGAFYLAVYSAGLAIPLLLSALLLTSLLGTFARIKRHYALINLVGGILLIGMGVLLFAGRLDLIELAVCSGLHVCNANTGSFRGVRVGALTSFAAGLFSFLSPCVLPLIPGYLSFVSGVAVEDLLHSEGK